jgi:hypothetical protein
LAAIYLYFFCCIQNYLVYRLEYVTVHHWVITICWQTTINKTV